MPTIPDLYKECGKCKQVLGFVEFGPNAKTPSGLKSYCRACHNADGKQYYAKNKAKVDFKNTQWAKSNREKVAVVAKRWRDNNPEKTSTGKRLWRELNADKVIAQKQAWTKANPDKANLYSSKRRASKALSNSSLVTAKDFAKMYSQDCIYCGSKAEHIDHIIPLSRGGRHSIGNLAPACAKCNLSKGSKLLMEWKMKDKV